MQMQNKNLTEVQFILGEFVKFCDEAEILHDAVFSTMPMPPGQNAWFGSKIAVLSIISSVYDPLGFLTPVTVTAKVMLQELCRGGCGWDDDMPKDIEH